MTRPSDAALSIIVFAIMAVGWVAAWLLYGGAG